MSGIKATITRRSLVAAMAAAGLLRAGGASAQTPGGDPLPSWNDGAVKKSITDFVARVTTQGGKDFVPVAERIATFDNDGTLWCEQPMYFQVAVRDGPREGAGAEASGMEGQGAVQGAARRRHEGGRRRRRERPAGVHRGDALRA